MTRKSRDEIKRAIERVDSERARETEAAIVYEHPETGEWIDMDGRPVDPDARPIMIIVPSDEEIEERLEEKK